MEEQNKIEDWKKEFDERFGARIDWLDKTDSVFGEATEVVEEFIRQLLDKKEREIKTSLFNSLINWAKREKQDYLWVGEKGCDMSYAYNLALEELIMYLKNKLKELKK